VALLNEVLIRAFPLKEHLLYRPSQLNVAVTERCNQKCKFCFRQSKPNVESEGGKKDISLELFKKILTYFPSVHSVSFAGQGEPTLCRDLPEMIKVASEEGIRTFLITNGTFSPELGSLLRTTGLDEISFSLNVCNKDDYERVCGLDGSMFDTILDNIRSALTGARTWRVAISFVISKMNLYQIPRYIDFGMKIGTVDRIVFHNYQPHNFEDDLEMLLFRRDNQTAEFLSSLKENYHDSKVEIIFPKLLGDEKSIRKICKFPFRLIRIDPKGNISGCGRMMTPDSANGNLFLEENPWNNTYFQRLRKQFLPGFNLGLLKACIYCAEIY